MTYAAPVLLMGPNKQLKRLQTKENKILRLLLDKPYDYNRRSLYRESAITPLVEQLIKQRQKFYTKCSESSNPLIRELTV